MEGGERRKWPKKGGAKGKREDSWIGYREGGKERRGRMGEMGTKEREDGRKGKEGEVGWKRGEGEEGWRRGRIEERGKKEDRREEQGGTKLRRGRDRRGREWVKQKRDG